jgi:hypothetical protein
MYHAYVIHCSCVSEDTEEGIKLPSHSNLHFNFPKANIKKIETIERLCFCTKNCTRIKEEAKLNVLLVVVNSNDLFPPRVTVIHCAYC